MIVYKSYRRISGAGVGRGDLLVRSSRWPSGISCGLSEDERGTDPSKVRCRGLVTWAKLVTELYRR